MLKKYKETLVSLYNTLYNKNINVKNLDDDGFNALTENLKDEYYYIKKEIKKNCSTENLTEKQIDFITGLSRYAHCLQKKKCRSKDEKTKIIVSDFLTKFTSKFPSTRYEGEITKFYQNIEAVFENMTVKDVIQIFQTIAKTNNLNQEQENYCKKYYEYRNLKCNSIKHFPKHQIELEFTKIEQTFRQLKLSNT
jgi:hypothetical protein